jgi:abequosyltransferase
MVRKDSEVLLSICIPTRGRVELMKDTLRSIYSSDVSKFDFEVVIYDSSDNNELYKMIRNSFSHTNLIYKQGENHGFLNLIHALNMGNASFLKLHNDYSVLRVGALSKMLSQIKSSLDSMPLLFFANNVLKAPEIKKCETFDNFLYNTTFYSSWSTAFGIWKSDFDKMKNVYLDPMFPHTSLLFNMTDKKNYIINNSKFFDNREVNKKGGYNLFETFAVGYLQLLENCLQAGQITERTFKHIKADMLRNFFAVWYYKTKILKSEYTFTLSTVKPSMRVYYSNISYYKMIIFAYIEAFSKISKNLIRLVFEIYLNIKTWCNQPNHGKG